LELFLMIDVTTLTAPNAHLDFDPTLSLLATDKTGKLILDPDTGNPVPIALDRISGKWYAKVADSMPWKDASKMKAIPTGAVHHAHDSERYRGVWVPIPAPSSDAPKKAN
jgi:hypothetical protein